jgi:DNA-binding CsgD family transcriptional regulator
MLLGRAAEMDTIRRLLDAARSGTSGALVIRGDLGTGKTSLLRFASDEAVDMRRLETAGVESESEFAYAGLHALIAPLQTHLTDVAEEHAKVLRGALALDEEADAGRLYIGAAMLALLGAAAAEQPLLCTLDDAHWFDPASADALRFAARRLDAEGVVFLVAAQEGPSETFSTGGLAGVELRGLDDGDSRALLEEHYAGRLSPAVTDSLVKATGGNPRALIEAPLLLSDRQVTGTEPIVGPLPVSEVHGRAIQRRLEALSASAEHALVIAAAADTHTMRVVSRTDETIGEGLEECERLGLVRLGAGQLIFPDPLVRSAAYQAATPAARRAAHAALAHALEGDPTARERRAWHLAAATVAPDDDVARELVSVAMSVQDRRGHAAAAALFENAARLSPTKAARDHRLCFAARAWWHAGDPQLALGSLEDAGSTDDPLLLADVRLLRAQIDLAGQPDAGVGRALVDAANEIEPLDPQRAAAMLAVAEGALPDAEAADAAARAVALADGTGGRTEVAARLAAARRAATPDEAAQHLTRVDTILTDERSTSIDAEVILGLASGLPEASPATDELIRRLTDESIDAARRYSVVALPHALLRAGRLDLLEGRWADASVRFDEAARLFEETGQGRFEPAARAEAAYLEALRGHEEACHEALRLLAGSPVDGVKGATEGAVLGALELGLGRADDAIEPLERWASTQSDSLLPPRWSPVDLVEALVRSSRRDEAARVPRELSAAIDPGLKPWIVALLDETAKAASRLGAALDAAPTDDGPFARARILLNIGERHRRDGNRIEAREQLRQALETFERLGADGWAERTRQELRASGEKLRRRTAETMDALTPQELQIARIVADGATYKEAAARLFLTQKTIEFHLGKVYRKLGVNSKREMGKRLIALGLSS